MYGGLRSYAAARAVLRQVGCSEWSFGLILSPLLRVKSFTSKQTQNKRQLPAMVDFVLHDMPDHVY